MRPGRMTIPLVIGPSSVVSRFWDPLEPLTAGGNVTVSVHDNGGLRHVRPSSPRISNQEAKSDKEHVDTESRLTGQHTDPEGSG